MNRAVLLVFALGFLLVAILLAGGAARETTGQPWQRPPPTQTARVIEVVRLEFVPVTQTPRPYVMPTATPETAYRWPTPTPYGPTRGIVKVR